MAKIIKQLDLLRKYVIGTPSIHSMSWHQRELKNMKMIIPSNLINKFFSNRTK